jgi:16S rRNA (guanine527-N7)-methyltransferase
MGASCDPGVGGRVTAAVIEGAVVAAGLKPLEPRALDQLAQYLELLLRWNARLNLTAVREPMQIVERHFIECIQCAQALPEVRTLLDFGSGAGLPGIPIAIVRPEISVTLGESQGKKAAFLREAGRVLGLNAEVFDQRIETMDPERTFDAVTLRAVDRMAEAATLGFKRVKPDGWMILFATVQTEEALMAALPGLRWERRIRSAELETGILMLGQRQRST